MPHPAILAVLTAPLRKVPHRSYRAMLARGRKAGWFDLPGAEWLLYMLNRAEALYDDRADEDERAFDYAADIAAIERGMAHVIDGRLVTDASYLPLAPTKAVH